MEFCTYPEWVGDGICDDSHNTKRCNFDGNDCCEGTFENCYTCKCHLNGNSGAQLLPLTANCSKFLIGDGVCDWWNDFAFCDYDGGDCRTTTTTTTTPSGITEKVKFDIQIYFDPFQGCLKPLWVGDGYCDDQTNTPQCNFDGGDCCAESPNVEYCTECQCK